MSYTLEVKAESRQGLSIEELRELMTRSGMGLIQAIEYARSGRNRDVYFVTLHEAVTVKAQIK